MRVALRAVVLPWALSRVLVFALVIVGTALIGPPERGVDASVPDWIALLGGWDTTWYVDLAEHGYEHDRGQVGTVFTNLAFFPLVPSLMAGAGLVGVSPFWSGVVIANLGLLAALAAMRWIGDRVVGVELSARAVWVLAFLPTSVYASLPYTEGLALGLAACAGVLAMRGRWAWAGVAAAAATLARPPGILAALLAALIALRSVGPLPVRRRRALLAFAPAAVALTAMLAWMQLARGSWRLPFRAQGAWDRGEPVLGLVTDLPGGLGDLVLAVVRWEPSALWISVIRDLSALAACVVLVVLLARRLGWASPWTLYSACVLVLPLSSGSVASLARFALLAFPLAWPAAAMLSTPARRRVALAAALVLTAGVVGVMEVQSP